MRNFGLLDIKRDLFGLGSVVQGAAALGGAAIQANAQEQAAQLESQTAANSLGFQQNVFNTQQANEEPWLAEGKTALGQLAGETGPGGSLLQPYGQTFNFGPFQAPTGADESNDPGYAFRLQQGQQALERSSAAKGTSTGGAALKAAQEFGQDYASNEYSNVYNRALQNYNTNYNTAAQTFGTNYAIWNQGQTNQYNRLASLAGVGQTANSQLGQTGQAAASNVAGINSTTGTNLANLATGQGNSISAGLVGAGNAITGGINNYQNYNALQQLLSSNQSGYAPDTISNAPATPYV